MEGVPKGFGSGKKDKMQALQRQRTCTAGGQEI